MWIFLKSELLLYKRCFQRHLKIHQAGGAIMHEKFGLNQPDFEKMVNDHEYQALADKLKASYESAKIRDGEYESTLKWLRESAKMHGLSIK